MSKNIAVIAIACMLAGCGGDRSSDEDAARAQDSRDQASRDQGETVSADVKLVSIDDIAENFVKLALGVGQHDEAFVDAYHGPKQWREEAKTAGRSLEKLETDARSLIEALEVLELKNADARTAMLSKNLKAALTRIRMARGETFSFDEETALLYDAQAPQYSIAEFDAALNEIDALLPGDGPLNERVDQFREALAIPGDKLDAVFNAAIDECRRRTLTHFDLPETERFSIGFVTGKPWSGYNWYQGDYESLIEVNTDLPIIIDRAVDLGCHEGYPGHHTWNVLLERDLLQKNGWIEYSVYPLFSPQSLIAEGSANYGIDLAFPGAEKIAFERDVLFPMAGLDPAKADTLATLNKARQKLSHARNHIARQYLNGDIGKEKAVALTMKYGLVSRVRAEKSVSFIDAYRGYVINYNLGRDLVADYVGRAVKRGEDPWAAFNAILTSPTSASDLAVAK